jgi:succinate dehydrogenase / fumarate reductase iron-sulfur subunit
MAFITLVRKNGLLDEAELLPRSYGGNSWFGKFAPPAALELADSLPSITKAIMRRKVTPLGVLKPHKIPSEDRRQIQAIYDEIENRDERFELNLYIAGYDEDLEERVEATGDAKSEDNA